MNVFDVCTREVVHLGADATVREAAELMRHRHVGMTVVVEKPNGECFPIGVLTDRDIVVSVVAPGIDPEVITVADVMTREITSCGIGDDLFQVLQAMHADGVRRLPVLDSDGALRGLISIDDIVAAIGAQLVELSAVMRRGQVREMQMRV
jgi:CBS domain-containing protein